MTNSCRQNSIGLRVPQIKGEVVFIDERLHVAVLEQGLGPEGPEVVSATPTADFVQQAVHALDVPIRIRVVEVVEDVPPPALLVHEGQERLEGQLQFLRQKLAPGVIGLLGFRSVWGLVDVIEPFLHRHRLLNGGVLSEYSVQVPFAALIQPLNAGLEKAYLVLEGDTLFVVGFGLDGLSDGGDGPVRVSKDVELVDHDHGIAEVEFVQFLVIPIHILRDHLDLGSVEMVPPLEVIDQVLVLAGHQDIQQFAALHIANDEPGRAAYNLLVHAKDAGQFEGVVLKPGSGVILEHAAHQAFLDAVDASTQFELHVDAVFSHLVTEAGCHVPLGIDAGQVLEQERLAVAASVALALDPQVRLFPLDREVSEVHDTNAMLHDVRSIASAGRRLVVSQDGLDVELPILFLGHRPHEAVQTQQIKTRHSNPPKRREHEPFGATCQMRNAA